MGPPSSDRHPLAAPVVVALLVVLLSCLAPAASGRAAGPVDVAVHAIALSQPAGLAAAPPRPQPAPPAAVVPLVLVPPLELVAVLLWPAQPLQPPRAAIGWAHRTRAPPGSR
jgi:hypothetical protein